MIKLNIHPLVAGVGLALAFPVLAVAAPVDLPHTFADGDLILAEEFNENFDALQIAVDDNDERIAAVEQAVVPRITVRKTTGGGTAIAFCEADEVLTGGGCFLPPENHLDPAASDYGTYFTGNYPRVMVGMTSVPVAAGTEPDDVRPMTSPGSSIIPFAGDLVPEEEGAAEAEPGGGWACRPGMVQHNAAAGAQAVTTGLYEGWYFRTTAYAVCMKT